jgi:hypothetical protein
VPWDDAIVVWAGKLRKLWDWLSELCSSVGERRLEKDSSEACAIACQNCAVYSVFPSVTTPHSKIAQFNGECIGRFRKFSRSQKLPSYHRGFASMDPVCCVLLYPAWSRWGTYLGCCSKRDRAWNFRDKKVSLERQHTLGNNPHDQSMIDQLYSKTLITVLRGSADSNCSTRQLLYIHYRTHGPRDKHSAGPCYVTLLRKV